jgi:hypothetical protein
VSPQSFALTHVHLENYRGFLSIDVPLDGTTVVIARNGAGKSSFLGGIASALSNVVAAFGGGYGCWPVALEVGLRERSDPSASKWGMAYKSYDSSTFLHSANTGAETLPLIRYYPSPRRVVHGSIEASFASVMASRQPRSFGYERWWDAEPNLTLVAAWVLRQQMLGSESSRALELFHSAIVSSGMFVRVGFDVAANALVVTLPSGNTVQAEDLSEGQRAVLAIIGDLFFRASQLNPENDPSQISGVVLIDEIDEHLHPGAAQIFLPTLMKAFPNLQWIVSSHSPQVWQSAPEGSVHEIAISPQGIGSLTRIEYTEGAEAQVLLDLVGVQDRPSDSPVAKLIDQFEVHLERGTANGLEAQAILQLLTDRTGGTDAELVRLRGAVKLAEYRQRKSE